MRIKKLHVGHVVLEATSLAGPAPVAQTFYLIGIPTPVDIMRAGFAAAAAPTRGTDPF